MKKNNYTHKNIIWTDMVLSACGKFELITKFCPIAKNIFMQLQMIRMVSGFFLKSNTKSIIMWFEAPKYLKSTKRIKFIEKSWFHIWIRSSNDIDIIIIHMSLSIANECSTIRGSEFTHTCRCMACHSWQLPLPKKQTIVRLWNRDWTMCHFDVHSSLLPFAAHNFVA